MLFFSEKHYEWILANLRGRGLKRSCSGLGSLSENQKQCRFSKQGLSFTKLWTEMEPSKQRHSLFFVQQLQHLLQAPLGDPSPNSCFPTRVTNRFGASFLNRPALQYRGSPAQSQPDSFRGNPFLPLHGLPGQKPPRQRLTLRFLPLDCRGDLRSDPHKHCPARKLRGSTGRAKSATTTNTVPSRPSSGLYIDLSTGDADLSWVPG